VAASWTQEQILALAPDASSAKSGRDLAAARKWVLLGANEAAAWGLCQGSGKDPYQTQIDLGAAAFRCSCPSRKFPCKHGLGLFLLLAAQPTAFTETNAPDWVTSWLEARGARAEQTAQRAEAKARGEVTVDAEAQAKRAQERERKVAAGLDEVERWLEDLLRRGLAEAQSQPYSYWEGIASRMVDAQASGLARMLRDMASVPASGEGWPGRLLERLASLHLLVQGYRRIEQLSPETQAEIRARIGWTVKEEELLGQTGVVDRWLVLAQQTEREERLSAQRTWLWGEATQRPALVLQFAHGGAPFASGLLPGSAVRGELVFYPGACPLRAVVKERQPPEVIDRFSGYASFEEAARAYADRLSLDPWATRCPFPIVEVTPERRGTDWSARDSEGRSVPISPRWTSGWRLLAASGGRRVGFFGEWDGRFLHPLSAWSENRLVRLEPVGDAA
jgi:hypothetical protein